MLIVFEGPDGAGKSTRARAEAAALGLPLAEELARPLAVYGPAEAARRAPGFLPAAEDPLPVGVRGLEEVRAFGDAWHLATALLARGGASFVCDRHWPSMVVYQRCAAEAGTPRPPLLQYLRDPAALGRLWAPFSRLVFLDAPDAELQRRIEARAAASPGAELVPNPYWTALVAKHYRLLAAELRFGGVPLTVESS